jgi:hypothetical protein
MALSARPIFVLVEGDVRERAGEVVVLGGRVEMAVAGEVKQNRPLLGLFVGGSRHLKRSVDRVCCLGRREDPFAPGKQDG